MFLPDGSVRPHYAAIAAQLATLSPGEVARRQRAADDSFQSRGITFAVNQGAEGVEKIMPFDLVPRVLTADEWRTIERGLEQRVRALNLPRGVYTHVAGSDLVRDSSGDFFVLEDNIRTPSGVSYVVENRRTLKRVWPQLFHDYDVRPVEGYPQDLLDVLRAIAPEGVEEPTVVVLTPGVYNSAYFEHVFLAKSMGVELVQGIDLTVDDGAVYMRTTRGRRRVDVIYRRVDDDFLDPLAFRSDSLLGVPGLMACYRMGTVSLANAVGTGVADDKAIYAYVPRIIQYYLSEDAILPNVPTYLASEPNDLAYIQEHLHELVIKAVNESGGYGMLIGPHSTEA